MLRLKNAEYPIYVDSEPAVFQTLKEFTATHSSIHIICDQNTEEYCFPILKDFLGETPYHLHSMEAGEAHKNFESLQKLYATLLHCNADRNALVINLGGGVVGDLGGFMAATYKRGIDFIQIPTSLLAMVDATIGAKLGYNFESVKNAVGCFKNPLAVMVYTPFLNTLDADEKLSGWAEMLKHALISDLEYWQELTAFDIQNETSIPAQFIERSLAIKLEIVQKDPFEKGERKLLNLGHTLGHALESLALEEGLFLPHGAAVALGILGESFCAHKMGLLNETDLQNIESYVLPIYAQYLPKEIEDQQIVKWIKNDKKNSSGKFNFTLLSKIGEAKADYSLDIEYIKQMVDRLNHLYEI